MLALKELAEDEELVFQIPELEEGRGVVAIRLLRPAPFLLVTGADGPLLALSGFESRGLVLETLNAKRL